MQKKDLILKLKKRGLSYAKIGEMFGVSRQRIHQLLPGYDSRQHLRDNTPACYVELKKCVLLYYGKGKLACVKCGFDDIRALSIDHIKGNGGQHRKEKGVGGGVWFYRWLEKHKYPKGYQTLCMNCQRIKQVENKEFYRKPTNAKSRPRFLGG